MAITSSNVTTTASNIYVSSGGTHAAMTFYFTNYSVATPATFTLYAVGSGYSANNFNMLYSNVLVQAGDTYVMDSERLFLEVNDSLVAKANANNAISCTLTYTDV
jgi:hypothetical protein